MNDFSMGAKAHGKTLIVLSSLLGLFLCLSLSHLYFAIDSDFANSPIVWHEIEKYGFSALKQWRPTPDNWYFSIYPIHFTLFKLFGSTNPLILEGLGMFQVFVAAVVAAMICYEKTKNHYSFLLIPFFCTLSFYAFAVGYISHPFSHNLTNTYGLICLYLFITNQKKKKTAIDLIICILTLLASISDPWFLAAYFLPMILIRFYDVFFLKAQAKTTLILYSITAIILFTHVIEKKLNLPIARFHLGSPEQMLSNAYWFLVGVGGNLNFFFIQNDTATIASTFILMGLYISANLPLKKENSTGFLILLSIAGISAAFILGSTPGAPWSGRFFVNIVYLSIVSICASGLLRAKKHLILPLIVLFFSGLYSHFDNIHRHPKNKTVQIYNFLKENKLQYGFGPYWGTQALAVSWLSNWNIVVKPVTFDTNTGYMSFPGRAQTFDYWYLPEYNQDKKRQFIAILNDGEECKDVDLCLAGIKKQYGEPAEILHFNNINFYVYDKQIIQYSAPDVSSSGMLTFGNQSEKYFWPGWSFPEEEFRWTEGKSAEIILTNSEKWNQGHFKILASSIQPIKGAIFYHDTKVKELDLVAGNQEIQFNIQNIAPQDKTIKIRIEFEGLKTPRELGINRDKRKLGLAVQQIAYEFD